MNISYRHRFIFLSNPRCGATTIRNALRAHTDVSSESILGATIKAISQGTATESQKQIWSAGPLNLMFINAPEVKHFLGQIDDSDVDEGGVKDWAQYYSFTTIRNPFKKFVSWYFAAAPDKNFKTPMNVDEYDETTSFHHHFNDFVDYGIHNDLAPPAYKSFCCDPDTDEQLLTDVFKLI